MTSSHASRTPSAITARPAHSVSKEPVQRITLAFAHPVGLAHPLHRRCYAAKARLSLSTAPALVTSSPRPLGPLPDSTPKERARRLSPTPLFPKS